MQPEIGGSVPLSGGCFNAAGVNVQVRYWRRLPATGQEARRRRTWPTALHRLFVSLLSVSVHTRPEKASEVVVLLEILLPL